MHCLYIRCVQMFPLVFFYVFMFNPNQIQNSYALVTPMLLSLRENDSTCMSAHEWLKFHVVQLLWISYSFCQSDIEETFHCVFIQICVLA